MRITYDPAADAVYIHLTSQLLTPGRTTIQAGTPPAVPGFIALDWKDGRLVGIEILDASTQLHPNLLEEAEILSENGRLLTERSRSVRSASMKGVASVRAAHGELGLWPGGHAMLCYVKRMPRPAGVLASLHGCGPFTDAARSRAGAWAAGRCARGPGTEAAPPARPRCRQLRNRR